MAERIFDEDFMLLSWVLSIFVISNNTFLENDCVLTGDFYLWSKHMHILLWLLSINKECNNRHWLTHTVVMHLLPAQVFQNIRDDELEHVKTMINCQDYEWLSGKQVSHARKKFWSSFSSVNIARYWDWHERFCRNCECWHGCLKFAVHFMLNYDSCANISSSVF